MTDRCKHCGAFDFFGTHKCPPSWRAYVHGRPEEALTVYAHDGEDAAEKFASEFCMDDGQRFEDGGAMHVVVESQSSGDPPAPMVYVISMSLTWDFSADHHSYELAEFDPEDVW